MRPQADCWRRFYWDFSLLSSRDWRVSHMLSHHLHTNTYNDIEVYGIEPFLAFLPTREKNFAQKYLVHFYIQVFYFLAFPIEYLKKAVLTLVMREDSLRLENLLPLLELFLMSYLLNYDCYKALHLWSLMHAFCGFWLISTSLIASHHHPDIYHAGDIGRYLTLLSF